MATFPRELLKWLQSLNITSSIKNVKFDFGNGFVVAEILNRYYPQDVRLNSFDTGQSKNCRKENWQLLKRMFNKFGISVLENDINDLVNKRMNSGETAARIISALYSFFLKKNVKPPKSSGYIRKNSESASNGEDNIQIENNKEALKLMLIDNQKVNEATLIKKDETNYNIYLLEYIFGLFEYKGPKKIFDKTFLEINNLSTIFLDLISKTTNENIQNSIEEFKNKQDDFVNLIQNSNSDDIIFLIQLCAHILSLNTINKKSFKVSVIIIPIIFSSIKKSIGSEGIKLLYNSNSYDEIINGMTIEKIPFFSGCIEAIANGFPIEEKQTQDIYDKIKKSLHQKNINYELAFITTISVIDPSHAYFHINSVLSILNAENETNIIDYSAILHFFSILIPSISTDFIIPLLRKFNILKKGIKNKIEQLHSIKDMDIETNDNARNGLIRSWIRFLTVIIEVLGETTYSNGNTNSFPIKKKEIKNKNKINNTTTNGNTNANNNTESRCSSAYSLRSNDSSRLTTQKTNINFNKTFIHKKKNIKDSSIELPNGEIIELPSSLEDLNLDEIYPPTIFCKEIVNEALNELVLLLPTLCGTNLKIVLFLLAPNLTLYTNLCQEFVKHSVRISLKELYEIFPLSDDTDKLYTYSIDWQVPYFNSIEKITCFEITDDWRFCYCMGFINMMKGNENKYYYEYLEYFIRKSNHPMPVIMENVLIAMANDENQLKYGLSILEHLTFTDEHLLKLLTTVLYIMEYSSNNTKTTLQKWLSHKTTEEEKIHMNKIKKWINNETQKMINC
ncbi:hypothetical protein BCR36DRAFT_413269 [Piromyces finnis]|uniref:Calponin-homology (CH) domain-containing protein n=1 Tax=Piromyces finnis TaxID=1754191 RepID=A0A1Y1V603_9FUNG|nr:hypothetical protein BCR36DRAFT_413269 [Piromyces finnis]|eukprot:ORX48118.1 hypothetical protein BCR36DRAFT_413269 [Piromyces finnis]